MIELMIQTTGLKLRTVSAIQATKVSTSVAWPGVPDRTRLGHGHSPPRFHLQANDYLSARMAFFHVANRLGYLA